MTMPSPVRLAGERLVRRGLRGVWVRGVPPAGPFVWAANHHSWWDPFVAAVVIGRTGHVPCVLMDQDNLDRYRVARLLGAFGTGELRRGLDHLRRGRVLVIFPEGELRPAGPIGSLAGGAAWYARSAGVPLCAAATRVVIRGHQAAEAYVAMSTVAMSTVAMSTVAMSTVAERALEDGLGGELAELDRLIAGSDPRRPLPAFRRVLRGRPSWDERWAR